MSKYLTGYTDRHAAFGCTRPTFPPHQRADDGPQKTRCHRYKKFASTLPVAVRTGWRVRARLCTRVRPKGDTYRFGFKVEGEASMEKPPDCNRRKIRGQLGSRSAHVVKPALHRLIYS